MPAKRNSWNLGGRRYFLFIVLLPLAFVPPAEAKTVYTMLPANTQAFGINDSGAVTGYYGGGGFLRTPDGTLTLFHAPGDAQGTFGSSINANDTIAGSFVDASKRTHGFVRSPDGTITTFDAPGAGRGTFPGCITASGAVGGYFADDGAGLIHGFVRAPDGTMTVIDVPGSSDTDVAGINAKGAAAGNDYINGASHGFVRNSRGEITTFDVPGDHHFTSVSAINDKGEITGNFGDENGPSHGYIRFADGTFTAFDAGGSITDPHSINSKGEAIGEYLAGKKFFGFIRNPHGLITSFHVPGTSNTLAFDNNTAGVIAGTAYIKTARGAYTPVGFIRTP